MKSSIGFLKGHHIIMHDLGFVDGWMDGWIPIELMSGFALVKTYPLKTLGLGDRSEGSR